ncbi:putative glutamine--fructose-6-phosphate transaminase (isomerizing) [Peptoniphilus sp. oral taxon 375 str. F0436]|nr:putative glutamine--fructose-6-phosphate transaminase (isomerizing) [Peptoniphilus sp. oral taxon 375 str. F0436]
MCGIVGYCGLENAEERIIQGLEKLEYRGYDSAGISIINSDKEITTVKRVGKLKALKEALKDTPLDGRVGVGHTRWATHGVPSDVNSHPQLSQSGKFAVVHNGIIENFLDLKKELQDQGYQFKSDTDTEVISNLFEFYQEDDFLATALKVSRVLEGAYAIGVICQDHPDQLIAIRHESPLVIGVEEKGYIIASDIPALLNYTRDVISLKNGELALVDKDSIHFYDFEGHSLEKIKNI